MAISAISLSYSWVLIALVALYWTYVLSRFASRDKNLPPGPPGIPILGNAHQLIGNDIHKRLRKWGDEYGEIYSLKIGKGTMIVLNSKRIVHDLVDKRSALYSYRPQEQQFWDFARGENMAVADPNSLWKMERRLLVQYITPTRLDGPIARIFEAEINVLMKQFLEDSTPWRKHIKRCTASAACIMLWGQRAKSYEDFWVTSIYEGMDRVNDALAPGSYLPIEQFPILRFIPKRWNAGTARAEKAYSENAALWLKALDRIYERRDGGDKRESLLDNLLEGRIKTDGDFSRSQFANFFGSIVEAAADTSAVATITSLMHLAKHPEVQEKARVELDKICGTERSPKWSDFKDAPYINCIVKEGLRMNPVAPMGFPHRVPQDDWFEGMLIPKDATVLLPSYGLGRTQYEDGDTYNPDRYLNHPRLAMDYASSPDYNNRDHYGYGAGRRICAGIHLAERTQWRIIACLLWGFTIGPGIDENTGEEAEIDTEAFEHYFTSEPLFFPTSIKVRSAKHAEVIRREFAEIEEFLKKWE